MHNTIVLEGLRSDFRVFGENLADVRSELKQHTQALHELNDDVHILKEDAQALKEDAQNLKKDVRVLKGVAQTLGEDMQILKADTALIRHNQVTRDEFKFLESRVARLEKKAL